MGYEEKWSDIRVNAESDMTYRLVNAQRQELAYCCSLSCTGLSFIALQYIDEGKALEVNITVDKAMKPMLTAFVEVIRVTAYSTNQYEITTSIKTIKG